MKYKYLVFSGYSLTAAIVTVLMAIAPAESVTIDRTDPSQPITECPEDTDEVLYHVQGYDKQGGIICGFTFVNECPYFSGAPVDDPACEPVRLRNDAKLDKPQPTEVTQTIITPGVGK